MRPFPTTKAEALRHFSTIVVDETPLVDVFCVGTSLVDIKRSYRKLALLIHPDQAGKIDPRGSARCMAVLSRAIELAKKEQEYDDLICSNHGVPPSKHFHVSSMILFTRAVTPHEQYIRLHEQKEKMREESREAGRAHSGNEREANCTRDGDHEENRHGDVYDVGEEETAQARRAEDLRQRRRAEEPRFSEQTGGRHTEQELNQEGDDCESSGEENGSSADEDEQRMDITFNPADYILDFIDSPDRESPEDLDPDIQSTPRFADATCTGLGNTQMDEKSKRRLQKRLSKQRALHRAKAALHAEKLASRTWKPRRVMSIRPVVGMCLNARWKCEQLIRAHTAHLAVQEGVNIHQTVVKVVMKCRVSSCDSTFVFDWQPKSGSWKLNKYREHINECFGQQVPLAGSSPNTRGRLGPSQQYCAPAYTAQQVARAILEETCNMPNINSKTIASIVKAKGIYHRQPPYTHYRAIRRELMRHLTTSRAVNMAALDGYTKILEDVGHKAKVYIFNGLEMKEQRLKAARHIFSRCKKEKSIPEEEVFNADVVDCSDINEQDRYYGGFIFVPSIAAHICETGRKTCAADAAHCDGVGPQSYGTTFEVVCYDCNNHLIPIVFAHFVGPECLETWRHVFLACAAIDGFDIPERTTIVDQEKSIDGAYRECLQHARLFLDPLHVKKNLGAKLDGADKAMGLQLYEKAVYAPTVEAVNQICASYSPAQKAYLENFDNAELYMAYSRLQDLTRTSQGAESQMSAALRNNIRSVEPQKMITTVLLTQRSNFLKHQAAAGSCMSPVPPYVEKHLAQLIRRARCYQSSVTYVPGTSQMEATVRSQVDGSITRTVTISDLPQTPPRCCAYSEKGSGFPCLHGVAVICEKYGTSNLYKFIERRHLTTTWKTQYENIFFSLPHQSLVDDVILAAKRQVISGKHLQVPKAIPPPRGRPVKNAGKRRKGWYERGPTASKRRSYSCSLCHLTGHVAKDCSLRQLFSDTKE